MAALIKTSRSAGRRAGPARAERPDAHRFARHLCRWTLRCAAAAFWLLQAGTPLSASPCTETALVLSLDNSGSVSREEFELEKHGLAGALRDGSVQGVLFGAEPAKVAVLFWGDPAIGTWTGGWHLLRTPGDAERLAREIELAPRLPGGNTGLGAGLAEALALLSRPEACARRRIVNISGDGSETNAPRGRRDGPSIAAARAMAEALGVTVNGLVITSDEPDIAEYYRDRVISGPGAFVMAVERVEDYAEAIRLKIMRETALLIAAEGSGEPGRLAGVR